jgi:uncharacterized delta-60 repeat protein
MRFKKTGLVVAAGLLVITPIVASAAAGDLDSGFGDDGIVTTDVGLLDDYGQATAIQEDGKIIVAGYSYNATTQNDFSVVRYNTDGSLDEGFGTGGKVITDIDSGTEEQVTAVAIQSDGKIVVAGQIFSGVTNYDFAVVRYNTDGALDTSFGGGDGKVTTVVGNFGDFVSSVALQANGKIVVVGSRYNGVDNDFAVVRYNTDGTLDTSFDGDTGTGNGKVITDVAGRADVGKSVAIQSDGKIVVAGHSYGVATDFDFAVLRYDTDGTLDTDFGGTGIVITSIGLDNDFVYSIALQSDGKIVVTGEYWESMNFAVVIVRYDTDGTLDTSFDDDGIHIIDISGGNDQGAAVAIQDNGKIVVAGSSQNGPYLDFATMVFNADGSLDTSFGGTGIVTMSIGPADDLAYSVAIQDDGRIVVAGYSVTLSGSDFAVVRYEGQRIRRARPSRTLVFDAAGGICSGESASWTVRFRGTYTLPTDCTRDGHVFLGWTRDPALTAPEHLLTDTISRSANLTAVWGALPAAPASVKVLANFLCGRDCTSALVVWPVGTDTAVITVDGLEATCSTRGEGLELRWCLVAGLASGSNHTASVSWRNQYGEGPATTTAFTLL